MGARIFTDKDASLDPLREMNCAIIGFGSQGRAHALNLRDSGIRVLIGLPGRSKSRGRAKRDGFVVTTTDRAVRQADLIFLALPDTRMPAIYDAEIAPHLRAGQTLVFAHGFAIHYRTIIPPNDVDVVMVAPKGLGPMVRTQFVEGHGVPCAIAIQQDFSGRARLVALAYTKAIGGTRAGVIETTFREETEADLFAEQAVLCGGVSALIQAGFETLVEAGYQPETAYFECLHELKFIVDLIHQAGLGGMLERISETAKWGALSVGPTIIDRSVKMQMKEVLVKIQRGEFAKTWLRETATGRKRYQRLLEKARTHPIEQAGDRLRALMPWLDEKS